MVRKFKTMIHFPNDEWEEADKTDWKSSNQNHRSPRSYRACAGSSAYRFSWSRTISQASASCLPVQAQYIRHWVYAYRRTMRWQRLMTDTAITLSVQRLTGRKSELSLFYPACSSALPDPFQQATWSPYLSRALELIRYRTDYRYRCCLRRPCQQKYTVPGL